MMVERVARAISIPEHHTSWDSLSETERDLYRMQADYALKAILSTGDDAGLVELIERCQRIADYSEAYRSGVAASCLREAAAAILSLTARNKALEEELPKMVKQAYIEGHHHGRANDTITYSAEEDWERISRSRAALNHQDNRQKGGGE
jgi:hypothetical protein